MSARVMLLAPGFSTGDPRLYHLECRALADAGYRVELAAHPQATARLDPRIKLHSLGQHGEPGLAWRLYRRARRNQQAYRLARHARVDLYHYHSLDFILWGARLRRTLGRPVIFDCREDFEGYARQRRGIPDMLRPLLARIVRQQLRFAATHCDAIIVADQGTARLLQPRARRVLVLHNFPRLDLFLNTQPPPDRMYDIVYHGSLPRYHLEACLAIDDVLSNRGHHVQWRLVGVIPELDWLTAELKRRGIQQRFSISGVVPHDRIATEVVNAKIGIIPLPRLPKFEHNIPQKLFEFMALGLPVVMSDLPPSRPFVGDGACALTVPPDDYAAYADAIIRLLADPPLRQRMGLVGRQRVEEHYNWDRESQKLIGLYRELLGA